MKNILKVLVICFCVVILLTNVAFASVDDTKQKSSTQEKIDLMVADGLSLEDATYYAKLDDMVKKMEAQKEEFVLDPNTPDLSDTEVVKDTEKFREKVLSGDKAAMKKALKSLANILNNGIKDLKKEMDKNPGKSEYVIVYPDGSKAIGKVTATPCKTEGKVEQSDYEETSLGSGTLTSIGSYNGYAEFKLQTAVNYAKVRVSCTFQTYGSGSTMSQEDYAEIKTVDGLLAAYGICSIAQQNPPSIVQAWSLPYKSQMAECMYSALTTVSASFTASYGVVSVSVSANNTFTQRAIYRIYGNQWGGFGAVYD